MALFLRCPRQRVQAYAGMTRKRPQREQESQEGSGHPRLLGALRSGPDGPEYQGFDLDRHTYLLGMSYLLLHTQRRDDAYALTDIMSCLPASAQPKLLRKRACSLQGYPHILWGAPVLVKERVVGGVLAHSLSTMLMCTVHLTALSARTRRPLWCFVCQWLACTVAWPGLRRA